MLELLLSMFTYKFMLRAFISGLMVAALMAIVGSVMVHRRLSMIGDSLSHTSLAGVAIGLIIGINPTIGAILACLVGAFVIELIRKALGKHSELAVAIVLSLGVGLAGVLSGFSSNPTDFSSFLFGSIVATTWLETILVVVIGIVVLLIYILNYRQIFLVSFDEQSAGLMGVNVRLINIIITIITALTIAISARIVGTLIITSLMIVPVATSMQFAKSYKSQVIWAILISVFATILGIVLSFVFGLKPGGTICLITVAIFIISMLCSQLGNKVPKS